MDWLGTSLLATTSLGLLWNKDKVGPPTVLNFGIAPYKMTVFEDLDFRPLVFYFCGNVFTMYSLIWIALGLFILTVTVIRGHGCYLASSVIHETLLFNILRSPSYFFDITPTGRIINRFARDIWTQLIWWLSSIWQELQTFQWMRCVLQVSLCTAHQWW